MFCANCGKEIAENSRFCEFCGSAQPSPGQPPKSDVPKAATQKCELHLIPKHIKAILYIYVDEMEFAWYPFTAKEIVVNLIPGGHRITATAYKRNSLSESMRDLSSAITFGLVSGKGEEDSQYVSLESGEKVYREISMTLRNKVYIKEIDN